MGKPLFTTYETAKFCKADISTIKNWIDEGKLDAYKTPGGHRRIRRKDLIKFMKKYRIPIPPQIKVGKIKVLIVDDESNIVRIITRLLKKQKWELKIESACDGYEAGVKISNFFPDLLILDIKLPGIDGHKIIRNVKSNKELRNVKILAISGNGTSETKEKVISEGADAFMAKPFYCDELISKIAKLLNLSKIKS